MNFLRYKTYSILQTNGIFIFDCFNKSWRDQIEPKFEKILYYDDEYKLMIKRNYDNVKGLEKTWYELYYKNQKIKEYDFIQKFFSPKDIYDILDKKMWNSEISDSLEVQLRTNSQKHVLVLRKK